MEGWGKMWHLFNVNSESFLESNSGRVCQQSGCISLWTPFFLTSFYEGERPLLPMIDLNFTKENALPNDLWGLIYKEWKPTPEEGVTVFLQGLQPLRLSVVDYVALFGRQDQASIYQELEKVALPVALW